MKKIILMVLFVFVFGSIGFCKSFEEYCSYIGHQVIVHYVDTDEEGIVVGIVKQVARALPVEEQTEVILMLYTNDLQQVRIDSSHIKEIELFLGF